MRLHVGRVVFNQHSDVGWPWGMGLLFFQTQRHSEIENAGLLPIKNSGDGVRNAPFERLCRSQ